MRYGRDNPHFFSADQVDIFDSQPHKRLLTVDSRLFTIGSCFSINFARWFSLQNGVELAEKPDYYFNSAVILGVFQNIIKTTPEFHYGWPAHDKGGDYLIDGFALTTRAESLPELRRKQASMLEQQRLLFSQATLVLVTLGLSVVWEERIHDKWVALNNAPPATMRTSDKFRVRHQTVAEIKNDVSEIVKIIRDRRGATPDVIFTVSPIPLKASFTGVDVFSSSLYSKATLLVALHELGAAATLAFDYFPAFEYFWLSLDASSRFQRDGRHPTAEAVEEICMKFVARYADDPARFRTATSFTVPAV